MSHWGSLVILVQHSTAATFGCLEGVVVVAESLAVPVRAQSTPAAVAAMEVSSVELRSFPSVLQPQVLGFTRNGPQT